MKNWIQKGQKGQKGFEVKSPTLKIIESFATPDKKFTPYAPKEKPKSDVLDLSEANTFGEAFRIANKRLGEGNTFTYKGKSYGTDLKKSINKNETPIGKQVTPDFAKKSYDIIQNKIIPISPISNISSSEDFGNWNVPQVTTTLNKLTEKEKELPDISKTSWNIPQVNNILNRLNIQNKEVDTEKTKERFNSTKKTTFNTIPEDKKPIVQDIIKQFSLPEDVKTTVSSKVKDKKFETFNGKYYVLSKEDGNIYAFDKNHKLIDSTIAGRGATLGDFPNIENENSKKVGKHATTRAGSAVISSIDNSKESVNNYGTPFYRIKYNDIWQASERLGLHGIYKNEYEFRKSVMDNPKILNKLISWGCINIKPDWLKKPSTKPAVGDSLFITPEPKWNAKFSGSNLYR